MEDNNNVQRPHKLPAALILIGILSGLLLSLLAVWADYEASAYGFMRRAQTPLRGLSCPMFIGRNESSTVSVKITNPTERSISPGVWTQISTSQEFDSKIDYVKLGPGEQLMVQRTIGPENVDLGMFIFVDALVYSMHPVPDRENTCGILVLPVARGAPVSLIGSAMSILFLSAGMFLYYKHGFFPRRSRSILFMVTMTVLAMLLAFMGLWFPSLVAIILTALTLVITAGSFFS